MRDATRDFTSLIQILVNAGTGLEKTLAIQRELGEASLKAVQDSRDAQAASATAADAAKKSEMAAHEFLELTSKEYGTVSSLVQQLQQRIAALSVLATPIQKPEELAARPHSNSDSDASEQYEGTP